MFAARSPESIFPFSARQAGHEPRCRVRRSGFCANAAPNHVTGEPAPVVAGETYRVWAVLESARPCGRSDALLDIGIAFARRRSRFRLPPKSKFAAGLRDLSAPSGKETV